MNKRLIGLLGTLKMHDRKMNVPRKMTDGTFKKTYDLQSSLRVRVSVCVRVYYVKM